jgi:rare lipoprotein A
MKLITLLSIMLLNLTSAAEKIHTEVGKASWYSTSCNHGTKTTSGKKLDNSKNTGAHRTLPFGTIVKITNLKNGKSETLQIIDRGPFTKGRIIDVTSSVAEKLGFKSAGIALVRVEVVGKIK